jgi:hypothetical protein
MESYAGPGPSEFDDITGLTNTDALSKIICFDFFSSAAGDTCGLVLHQWIAEHPPGDSRPGQVFHDECAGWAYIGFRVESEPEYPGYFSDRANQSRIQVFLAHTAEARSTLHTLVVIDPGAMDRRVNINGAHRANGYAIRASHAFLRIDLHGAKYNTTVWAWQNRRAGNGEI